MNLHPTAIQYAIWQMLGGLVIPRPSSALNWGIYLTAGGQAQYIGKL